MRKIYLFGTSLMLIGACSFTTLLHACDEHSTSVFKKVGKNCPHIMFELTEITSSDVIESFCAQAEDWKMVVCMSDRIRNDVEIIDYIITDPWGGRSRKFVAHYRDKQHGPFESYDSIFRSAKQLSLQDRIVHHCRNNSQ